MMGLARVMRSSMIFDPSAPSCWVGRAQELPITNRSEALQNLHTPYSASEDNGRHDLANDADLLGSQNHPHLACSFLLVSPVVRIAVIAQCG
jgi:hypothetical protein